MIGLEPITYRIWVCCSCQLSYISIWSRVRELNPHYFSLEGRCHTIRRTPHLCGQGGTRTPLLQGQYDNLCSDWIYSPAPLPTQFTPLLHPVDQGVEPFTSDIWNLLKGSLISVWLCAVAYLGIEPSSSGFLSSEFCVSADLHSNRKNLFAIQLNPECGFHFCLSPTLSYADKSVCMHHLLNL